MFCSKCGKEIPDNSKFCNYCGASIQEAKDTKPVKTSRELSLKEAYQKKYSVPQLEASIESLKQKRTMLTIFCIVSIVITLGCLGLGIYYTILSSERMTHYDIYGIITYDEPNSLYIALASLFYSLFALFMIASIVLPIINSTVINKKISKRKAVLKILEE